MKKILATLLVLVMAFSLAACGGKETPSNTDSTNTPSQPQSGQPTSQNADNSDNNAASNPPASDKLVVNDGSMLGVLQTVAEQEDFVINGLYISSESGQHKYEHVDDIEAFGTDGLNSEFELNEWIGFYIDTNSGSPMNIYIVRNELEADYSKITEKELEDICYDKDYPVLAESVPDGENLGFVGQVYVHPETTDPDLFNVFFASGKKVCYMVQLNLIPEHSAE